MAKRIGLAFTIAALLAAASDLVAQGLEISEFLAVNEDGLADEDGERSDWIEVHNAGDASTGLGGWFLTDDPLDLRQWRFPAVTLPAGGYLVVFASGKDRAEAGRELHSSFKLDGGGGYLALVMPDGATVAHEYAPQYPRQREDISYGIASGAEATSLTGPGKQAKLLVPRDGALALAWTQPGFAEAGWTDVAIGIGYDTGAGGQAGDPPRNLARTGSPAQSSTLNGFVAAFGVDGSFGNFTHTLAGANLPATWEVDLGGIYSIEAIVLHNRTSCCGSRLRDVTVSVLDSSRTENRFESQLLNPENALGGGGTSGPAKLELDLVALTGGPVAGAVVRVVRTPDPDLSGTGGQGNPDEADVLSLAEVEVFESSSLFRRHISTDVEDVVQGVNTSVYLRIPFTAAGPAAFERLKLLVQHDDGFIAHLNGREVARRNAPASPAWNSAATADRADAQAVVPEEIDVTAHTDVLVPGANLLAIQALNSSAADAGFLLVPELVAETDLDSAPRYFRQPTPGAANASDTIVGFVADTAFSVDRGFHFAPFQVEVTTETEGASIRYTLDGTPPSTTNGTLYAGPISISRTTTLRTIALRDGLDPTNVDTQTYLFLEDIIRQTYQATLNAGFPSAWGGTAPDYGMDPDVIGQTGPDSYGGKYAATIRDDLQAVPTLSIVLKTDDLFGPNGIYTNSTARGDAWERPASVELIHPDGRSGFQEDCGLRIHGGAFRDHGLTRKHSFRLAFRDAYGASKLDYPLFGALAVERGDGIVLRANSNDGWQWAAAGAKPLYIRDSFGRETVLAMGGVASHETFVHVYLNGIYWGLYNPVERPDHSFSASYHGGEKEDWDSISNGEVHNGDLTAWSELFSLSRAGLATDAAYQRLQGNRLDGSDDPTLPAYLAVESYIDYMITNVYVGNTDWPNKNYWAGRSRVEPAGGSISTGFQFYMWDSEWSMGIQSDISTNITGISTGVTEPYAALRANAEFRLLFADHAHRHFFNGGALHVDPQSPQWDPGHPERNLPAARFAALAGAVDRAVVAESARWGDQHASTPYTRDEHWEIERDNILHNYLPSRSAVVLNHLRSAGLYPSVAAPSFNQHGGPIATGFQLLIRAPAGTTYYTLDGTDPRLRGGAVSPAARVAGSAETEVLLAPGANARAFVPADGSLGLDWTRLEFDDGGWTAGTTGVGYERDSGYETLIGLDVEASMFNLAASVYLRVPFSIEDPSDIGALTLRMKYDDGYVAHVNGTKVAARNAPDSPAWASQALGGRPDADAVVFEAVELTLAPGLLAAGENVLAIQGLNVARNSADLLILPQLEASTGTEQAGIPLERSTTVRARALDGGVWSALNEATFVLSGLRLTEVLYHPRDPDEGSPFTEDDFEFVEVKNTGDEPASLAGVRIAGGIDFDFTSGAVPSLRPGELAVVVRNAGAFASRYETSGIAIAGEYLGKLSNAGDRIVLEGSLGETILDFNYADTWQPATDGQGYSLVVADDRQDVSLWGESAGWRASLAVDGSPGRDDVIPPPAGGGQRPGDANQDSRVDISDAASILGHLFLGSPSRLACGDGTIRDAGNVALVDLNRDGRVDLTDAVYLLNYLFIGGPPPVAGNACTRIVDCPDLCVP